MPSGTRPRTWGYWTRLKLGLLADYLDAFTTASKNKSTEYVYLDAFAGEGAGIDRISGEEFAGSARIAAEIEDPPFTRLRYFELANDAADALRAALQRDYPGRDIEVVPGDCNETMPGLLRDLQPFRWAPTFAFLDPDGMELRWSTLELLASHKAGYRRSEAREFKVELWMLFPSGGLLRTLALESGVAARDALRATTLFGNEAWRPIYEAHASGRVAGGEARDAYVNLMRWRLERDLHYRYTHALAIRNEQTNAVLYHMVFATDNDAGNTIMGDLYVKAAGRNERMRAESLAARTGVLRLPGLDSYVSGDVAYHNEAPINPEDWLEQ
jgi:three-Cys-motif partner protein